MSYKHIFLDQTRGKLVRHCLVTVFGYRNRKKKRLKGYGEIKTKEKRENLKERLTEKRDNLSPRKDNSKFQKYRSGQAK